MLAANILALFIAMLPREDLCAFWGDARRGIGACLIYLDYYFCSYLGAPGVCPDGTRGGLPGAVFPGNSRARSVCSSEGFH